MSLPSVFRRRLVQAGLGSLFLPSWSRAQSEGAAKLLRTPKRALVVGNSRYGSVPQLRNARNDASAIGGALGEMGFKVASVIDADRATLLKAIEEHVREAERQKSIGLFFFAGHGVQLAWSNFLLPVDVKVRGIEDIPAQCVDVNALVKGLTRAGNPMNVIILDACRDNPFEGLRLEQAGLSQMDAPPGSLLAYATAPGHGASDGSGENGLYTENLLREMKVREAKIEDVFKRVRLGVRRASKGTQIPWESTSLEEDFYFVPPEALRKRSEEEEERDFRQELALFEEAERAGSPAAMEGYLRRHPSGRFAELAQLRLDRLLAAEGEKPIEPVSAKGNPNSAGTARADTRFRVGDSYTYQATGSRRSDEHSGRYTVTVTSIENGEVVFNEGEMVVDFLGNMVQARNGNRFTPRQDQPLEYSIGRKWSTRFSVAKGSGESGNTIMNFKVAALETVTVPAGTFRCFRVDMTGRHDRPGLPAVDLTMRYWSAPGEVRRFVARERVGRVVQKGHVRTVSEDRHELVAFRQS